MNLPFPDSCGLYIHVPYCLSKCSYCDFYSQADSPVPLVRYVSLLQMDLRRLAGRVSPGRIDTVFFGGGTPSLLSPEQVAEILAASEGVAPLAEGAEVTLEANPGTLTLETLRGYRRAGVNRLSLGVQSLRDARLQWLGRGHGRREALRAVSLARQAGFDNLSLDYIFAQPGQSEGEIREDLAQILDLAPEHLSLYGLSVEEGTPLWHRRQEGGFDLPGEEGYARQYLLLSRLLQEGGYEHYEISNFARSGFRCRHNLGYWNRSRCLAIGAGAHGFEPREWGERWAIPPDLERYEHSVEDGKKPSRLLERFDRRGAMSETLYLGLRTADGVSEETFFDRFGISLDQAFAGAAEEVGDALVRRQGRWFFRPPSWLLYDHLITPFL